MEPYLSKIRIYPVKSLDPIDLDSIEVGIHSLLNDRSFAMLADDGRYVNGKRTGLVNQLKTEYDLKNETIFFSKRGEQNSSSFHWTKDKIQIEKYLSEYFDLKVHWIHQTAGELMDIPGASSVTVVSTTSLESLYQDYKEEMSLENLRLRFRTNLEIGGVAPYWEEQLFNKQGIGVKFRIGEVEMIGVSPRARCNVPPRDPYTGETDKRFVKTMINSRSASLPADSLISQYGNFYQFTVNTYLPESEKGKVLRIGDSLKVLDKVNLGELLAV